MNAERQAADDLIAELRATFLFAPFSNYAHGNLDACGEMMRDPNTVIGLGDGGAHVGLISDASFPTYLLAHWGRDRASGRPAQRRLGSDPADLPDFVLKDDLECALANRVEPRSWAQ